tara:strand:- start:477 stop:1055 length:579 start_codon:yes stop_codon:yes gene_type:complete
MALNAFNEFTDLDAVNGLFQQEPRVFAHDAAPITIGAINNSDPNHGLNMTDGGTDYAVDDVLTLSTGASASVAATLKVLAVAAGGVITNYELVNQGAGYISAQDGGTADNLTSTGGSGNDDATFTVTNINIPFTQKRGCCVYVGNGGGNLTVIMESGREVVFNNVVSGQFLPILIQRLKAVSGTAANILALY